MDIPPVASISEIGAPWSGRSMETKLKMATLLTPFQETAKPLDSLDITQAVSITGENENFKGKDYQEAYRLWNPYVPYPFDETALIENSHFNMNYFDGTEGRAINKVVENLIGTPLGATPFDDPRHIYVETLLKHQEYAALNDPLDTDYIRQLYMLNTDKGNNYYQLQVEKQAEAMNQFARARRIARNKPVPNIHFTARVARGVLARDKLPDRVPFKLFTPINDDNLRKRKFNRYESNNPRSSKINNDLRGTFLKDDNQPRGVRTTDAASQTIAQVYEDNRHMGIGEENDMENDMEELQRQEILASDPRDASIRSTPQQASFGEHEENLDRSISSIEQLTTDITNYERSPVRVIPQLRGLSTIGTDSFEEKRSPSSSIFPHSFESKEAPSGRSPYQLRSRSIPTTRTRFLQGIPSDAKHPSSNPHEDGKEDMEQIHFQSPRIVPGAPGADIRGGRVQIIGESKSDIQAKGRNETEKQRQQSKKSKSIKTNKYNSFDFPKKLKFSRDSTSIQKTKWK